MKNVAIGLVLLKIKVISSLRRFTLMTLRRFLSCPLCAVPSALLPTRDSLHCMGRDKRQTSYLIILCMMLPCLMKTLASCQPSILMTSWGEPSFFLLNSIGSTKQACIVEHIMILKNHKLHRKIRYIYTSKFKTSLIQPPTGLP